MSSVSCQRLPPASAMREQFGSYGCGGLAAGVGMSMASGDAGRMGTSQQQSGAVVAEYQKCSSEVGGDGHKIEKLPYQHRAFADFCMLVGRMFYDDASMVLLDFLVREQRAYTEADIRERLKWKDNLLHQKLYFLERQLLVQREQNFEKGSKSPVYWRVSPHVVLAVEWHYAKVLADLQSQVEASHRLQEFECSSCHMKHSALDAASGLLSYDDEHPLCRRCNEKLTISNSQEAKSEIRDRQERTLRQLAPLRVALDRVRNMDPPVFAPFTRADKNEQKRELEEKFNPSSTAASGSTVGATGAAANGAVSSSLSATSPKTTSAVGGALPSIAVAGLYPSSGVPGGFLPQLASSASVAAGPLARGAPIKRSHASMMGTPQCMGTAVSPTLGGVSQGSGASVDADRQPTGGGSDLAKRQRLSMIGSTANVAQGTLPMSLSGPSIFRVSSPLGPASSLSASAAVQRTPTGDALSGAAYPAYSPAAAAAQSSRVIPWFETPQNTSLPNSSFSSPSITYHQQSLMHRHPTTPIAGRHPVPPTLTPNWPPPSGQNGWTRR